MTFLFLLKQMVELLEGEIIAMSPEGVSHSYTHQSVSDYLRELLTGKASLRDAHPITLDNIEKFSFELVEKELQSSADKRR